MREIPLQRIPKKEAAVMNSRILHHIEGKTVRPDVPEVIDPFVTLAKHLDALLEPGPEKATTLRKLLESCDAAVRCRVADKENALVDLKVNAVNSEIALKTDKAFAE